MVALLAGDRMTAAAYPVLAEAAGHREGLQHSVTEEGLARAD